MFCFVALLPAIRELIFQYFAEQEKIQQNATYNAEIHEIPVKTRKTNPVTNDPYNQNIFKDPKSTHLLVIHSLFLLCCTQSSM